MICSKKSFVKPANTELQTNEMILEKGEGGGSRGVRVGLHLTALQFLIIIYIIYYYFLYKLPINALFCFCFLPLAESLFDF